MQMSYGLSVVLAKIRFILADEGGVGCKLGGT